MYQFAIEIIGSTSYTQKELSLFCRIVRHWLHGKLSSTTSGVVNADNFVNSLIWHVTRFSPVATSDSIISRTWEMVTFIISVYPAIYNDNVQYIPRNMHTVFALLCFVVVIHWLIFPYPSGLLHWHWGNLTIAPVPAKQPWWIWINASCEFIMNDCITTTKQSTTKPCAYFLGYTVSLCFAIQLANCSILLRFRSNVPKVCETHLLWVFCNHTGDPCH